MAIEIDAVSTSGNKSNADPWEWSHTCTGSNLVLVVTVTAYIYFPSSVTYNGDAMSLATSVYQATGSEYSSIYYLINPDVGSHTVSIDFVSATYGQAGAVSFTGADQVSQPDVAGTTSGAAKTCSKLLETTKDGDIIFDTLTTEAIWASTYTEGAGQTLIYKLSSGTIVEGGSSYEILGDAGSYTQSWTWDGAINSNFAYAVASFKPYIEGGTVRHYYSPGIWHDI